MRNLGTHWIAVPVGLVVAVLIAAPSCEPTVYAGPDATVRLPRDHVQLRGFAVGFDHRPATTWSSVAVPEGATVLFSHPHRLRTQATFDRVGAYVLRLTATDGIRTLRDDVAVQLLPREGQPPTAELVATPTEGEAPRTVVLDASGSTDADGTIVSYAFDFGDGSSAFDDAEGVVTHVYEAEGSYHATVTVTDDDGLAAGASVDVTIHPNPLRNGDFELGGATGPESWTIGSYQPGPIFTWEEGSGREGSHAVRIDIPAGSPNDAWWEQAVSLTPQAPYNLHGWARGMDIVGGSAGANVCVVGTWDRSDGIGGSFDWQPLAVTFVSDAAGEATVGPRLGFWASSVTGTLWADDLRLTSDDFAPTVEGVHLRLMLERSDLEVIDDAHLEDWVGHLDASYDALAALVGELPYDAAPIGVLSVRQYPGGLAVAGNPIRWQQRYVAGELTSVQEQGNWSFGILHEISHTFDLDGRWAFNGEVTANIKLVYVVETLGGRVRAEGGYYDGLELAGFFEAIHAAAAESGVYTWNAVFYRFIEIAHAVGWDAYGAAFQDFLALDPADVPTTALGKLELLLDRLSAASGTDVRTFFDPVELAWMEAHL